jgi:hypothetical protein
MTMLVIFYLSNLDRRVRERPSGATGGICQCILCETRESAVRITPFGLSPLTLSSVRRDYG